MILEVAVLDVKAGEEEKFEIAFSKAQAIISGMKGYISHELQKCIENPSRYVLLVNWEQLQDHTVGFRCSEEYKKWSSLLHKYYEPFPEVEHYEVIYENKKHHNINTYE